MVTGPKKTRFDRVLISITELHQDVARDRRPKIVAAFELQYNCRLLPSGPFKKLCGSPPLSSRSSFGDSIRYRKALCGSIRQNATQMSCYKELQRSRGRWGTPSDYRISEPSHVNPGVSMTENRYI
jgi:hypothetical protein